MNVPNCCALLSNFWQARRKFRTRSCAERKHRGYQSRAKCLPIFIFFLSMYNCRVENGRKWWRSAEQTIYNCGVELCCVVTFFMKVLRGRTVMILGAIRVTDVHHSYVWSREYSWFTIHIRTYIAAVENCQLRDRMFVSTFRLSRLNEILKYGLALLLHLLLVDATMSSRTYLYVDFRFVCTCRRLDERLVWQLMVLAKCQIWEWILPRLSSPRGFRSIAI